MSERVLIVDDVSDGRALLGLILRSSGYQVVEASGGEEAIRAANEQSPDLIILDIQMPDLNGFDVCKLLKTSRQTQHIPIIFLSGETDTESRIEALEIGGVDFIQKGSSRGELLARVKSHLRTKTKINVLEESREKLNVRQQTFDRELESAASLQHSLLPNNRIAVRGLEVGWEFIPCNTVAGDIFNVRFLEDGLIAIYMVDVSGHGVSAAMMTVSIAQMLDVTPGGILLANDSYAESPVRSTGEVLRALDEAFPLDRFGMYFTCVYQVLDLHSGVLSYSAAAHPPAIVITKEGELYTLDRGGTVIGWGGSVPFEEDSFELQQGDKVLLYTDGVTDYATEKGMAFGERRLMDFLRNNRHLPVRLLVRQLRQTLEEFAGGNPPEDDVSILGYEVTARIG